MSDEKITALIAEARNETACICPDLLDGPAISCGDHGDQHSRLFGAVIDALEASVQAPEWHLNPPPGWFVFGTHVGSPIPLEFWGADDGGMPIWERPAVQAPAVVDREALVRVITRWHNDPVAASNEILASGILQDAAEVEARGLEKAAEALLSGNPVMGMQWYAEWMRVRAQQVRESTT